MEFFYELKRFFLRYILTPYLVVVYATVAILDKDYSGVHKYINNDTVLFFDFGLIIVSACTFFLRLILIAVRKCKAECHLDVVITSCLSF